MQLMGAVQKGRLPLRIAMGKMLEMERTMDEMKVTALRPSSEMTAMKTMKTLTEATRLRTNRLVGRG